MGNKRLVPYLRITIEHVDAAIRWAENGEKLGKRRFSMRQWACGTTCCVAGAAAILAGYTEEKFLVFNSEKSGIAAAAEQLHIALVRSGTRAEGKLGAAFLEQVPDVALQQMKEAILEIKKERCHDLPA